MLHIFMEYNVSVYILFIFLFLNTQLWVLFLVIEQYGAICLWYINEKEHLNFHDTSPKHIYIW
jgi:hypothetical protein